MEIPESFLKQATQHRADSQWLSQHAGDIYTTISQAFKDGNAIDDAVDSLLLVYPYVLPHGDIKRWSKLLQDGVNALERQRDESLDVRGSIKTMYFTSAESKSLENALNAALRRARKRLKPATLLEVYINLFKSQVHRQTEDFNLEIVDSALKLARQVNDQEAYARLYQALAYAYYHWGEYDKALRQAEMAYESWLDLGSNHNAGLSAYIMAHSKTQMRASDALAWLERSAELLAKTDYKGQYAIIANETGMYYASLQNYAVAEQWFKIAVREAESLNYPPSLEAYRHCLGLTQTHLDKYKEAHANLTQALVYYEAEGDEANAAHVYHSLAYLEGRENNISQAMDYARKSFELHKRLPDTPRIQEQRSQLNILIDALEKGIDVKNLP